MLGSLRDIEFSTVSTFGFTIHAHWLFGNRCHINLKQLSPTLTIVLKVLEIVLLPKSPYSYYNLKD
jgi:hypothetical protein